MESDNNKRKTEDVQPNQDEEYERMLEEAAGKLKKRRKTDESVKAYLSHHRWDEAKAIRLGYKSRLCQFSEKGTCHKGILCQYAHGKSDLIQMKPPDAAASSASPANSAMTNLAPMQAPGFASGLGGAMDFSAFTAPALGLGSMGTMGLGPMGFPALTSPAPGGPGVVPVKATTSRAPRGPRNMRCTLYLKSMCRLGELCPWAHSPEELLLAGSMNSAGAQPASTAQAQTVPASAPVAGTAAVSAPLLPTAISGTMPMMLAHMSMTCPGSAGSFMNSPGATGNLMTPMVMGMTHPGSIAPLSAQLMQPTALQS